MAHRLQPETDHHRAHPRRNRIVAGVATLSLASTLLLAAPASIAQDGTGGAPPLEETGCVLVPASDIDALKAGRDAGSPVASPVAATPAAGASPVASPVATPVAGPTFNADLLLEDLTATSTSLASCLTEGRFIDVADRTSPLFRGQLIGTPQELPTALYATLAETFPPTDAAILEIANATLVDDTQASADVVWQVGHQVRVDRWFFTLERVQGLTMWVVDRAEPGTYTPATEATRIDVTIADNRYDLGATTVDGDAVQFDARNDDGVDHELLVLRLEGDASTSALLTTPGPEFPEGITFIGQATIPASASGSMLLVDLEPGTYAIVCLLTDENGLPHLADGMEATFEVS